MTQKNELQQAKWIEQSNWPGGPVNFALVPTTRVGPHTRQP